MDELHWHGLPRAIARVHIAHMNVFDLVGACITQPRETINAVHAALGTQAPAEIVATTGIFDRVFIGAEPQSERDFAMLLRLLRDGGRMVVPYKSELLLLRRTGDDLVSEPKMNVSFGPLAGSDDMINNGNAVLAELAHCRDAAARAAHPSALRPASNLRSPPPSATGQRQTRTTADQVYATTCCGTPVARALSLAARLENTIGDSLRVYDEALLVFAPPRKPSSATQGEDGGEAGSRPSLRRGRRSATARKSTKSPSSRQTSPSRASAAGPVNAGDAVLAPLKDAFDGQTVWLHGLGCAAVYVQCPCGRPVGMRVATAVQHAPQGEDWEGALLLMRRCVKSVTAPSVAGSDNTAAAASLPRSESAGGRGAASAGEVACAGCKSVVGHKTDLARETLDWFDLPPSSRDEVQAVNEPSSGFVRSATLSRSSVAPSTAQTTAPRLVTASLLSALDRDRVTLGPSRFSHYCDRNIRPCRYRMVHCSTCRATLGCTVLGHVHQHDLADIAPFCGNFVLLLSRVNGLQTAQRLDVLQRVFSALMGGGGASALNETPNRRFNPAELMELFSSGSGDEDDSDSDAVRDSGEE